MLTQTKPLPLPDLDLSEFIIEGQVNGHFAHKGWHKRIKCRSLTPSVLIFELMSYKLAMYVKETNELYKLDGCFNLHWMLIRNAIKLRFGDEVKFH